MFKELLLKWGASGQQCLQLDKCIIRHGYNALCDKTERYFKIISYSDFRCVPKVMIKVLVVFTGAAKGIYFKAHEIYNLLGGKKRTFLVPSIISQVDA